MTTIGPSTTISGALTSDEDIRIEGHVEGNVLVRDGSLIVAEGGVVTADIRGTRVVVQGRVDGSIMANERIELSPTAQVEGSLSANRVIIAEGARFNGRIDMDQRTIAAKLAQYKATQTPEPAQR